MQVDTRFEGLIKIKSDDKISHNDVKCEQLRGMTGEYRSVFPMLSGQTCSEKLLASLVNSRQVFDLIMNHFSV